MFTGNTSHKILYTAEKGSLIVPTTTTSVNGDSNMHYRLGHLKVEQSTRSSDSPGKTTYFSHLIRLGTSTRSRGLLPFLLDVPSSTRVTWTPDTEEESANVKYRGSPSAGGESVNVKHRGFPSAVG